MRSFDWAVNQSLGKQARTFFMDGSELKTSQKVEGIDWEKALQLYENVVACGDEASQVRATIKFAHLAGHAPEYVLERSIRLLVELLGSPLSDSNLSIQSAVAFCLKRIACQGDGKLAESIGQSGAIPSLLQLLQHSNGCLLKILLKCLRNILTCGNGNSIIVVENGGLEVVLNMLNAFPSVSRQLLLEILSVLTLLREVRRVIISLGGLCFLVESASCGKMITRRRAALAIGLLGLVKRARRLLVNAGTIPVLIQLIRDGDFQTKLIAGNALGVISSHVDFIRPVAQAGAIPLFVELIQGPDPVGKEIAEDVFCILGVVEENAVIITEHLVEILRVGHDEAKCTASGILLNLCYRKSTSFVTQISGAIPILVELLRYANVDVRENVCGVISQLSYNEADRVALADAGAISVLLDLLQDESEEVRDNVAEALVCFSEDPSLCDRVTEAFSVPAFRNMQNTMNRIHDFDTHLTRSFRQMSVGEFTGNPDLL